MAVVIETTLGDITVDLYLDQRPVTCLNFLKLCKMKYYNYNLFHTIRSDFIAQTGDPTGEGAGGESIWGILEGPQKRFFSGEKMPKIRHTGAGLLSMVCTNDMMVGSQFFFTLAPNLDSLDGTHCVIGEVTEGHEVLTKLNEVICDETNRPYRDVRITHTVVLEDPFNDPPGLRAPSRSPSPSAERLKGGRIAPDEEIDETQGKSMAEVQEMIEEKEAKARATILEIVGDLPDADIAPPENVLFVCKLNPVTNDDDLEIIFSRFGKIVGCEVIRDKKTGNSLQYAFIEFENKKSCEDAYFKMDNVLIDDRRIHVDFSQSVSKMRYLGKGRGVQYLNDEVITNPEVNRRDRGNKRNRIDDIPTKHQNDDRRQYSKESNRNDRDKESRKDRDRENRNDKNRENRNDRDRENRNDRNRENRNDRDRENRNDRDRENRIDKDRENRTDRDRENRNDKDRENRNNRDRENRVDRGSRNDRDRETRYNRDRENRSNRDRDIRCEREIENINDRDKTSKKNNRSRSRSRSRNHSREITIKNGDHRKNALDKYDKNYKTSNSVRERDSPGRTERDNSLRSHKNSESNREDKKSYDRQHDKHYRSYDKDSGTKSIKQKKDESIDRPENNNKKTKHSHNLVTKTPSPVAKNKRDKNSTRTDKSKTRDSVKKNKTKRKHKKTISSDSDSSESSSSSSSNTSSSSESDHKRNKVRRKKRKYSSTSSSDSSSSSSSSSSDSSSDSSSSSSDSEPSKKKAKKTVNSKSKKNRKK